MSQFVYADNASTTKLSETALKAMMPYLTSSFGNPSSVYGLGRQAKEAVEQSRELISQALGAKPSEICFTSGGTEADDWAIRSALQLQSSKGKHIIASPIEHHAILHTLEALSKQGYEVSYLSVDQLGQISLEELKKQIRQDTALITIMTANNEVGTVLPIAQIADIAQKNNVLFHTDAVQAVGHIPLDLSKIRVDLLSIASHKFKGPKGVGALFIRDGLALPSRLLGGRQERNRRAGTENVAGIVGMATALHEAVDKIEANTQKITKLRDRLVSGLLKIPYSKLTGDPHKRLPGTASFVFECVEGESLVLMLDQVGICASSGSACSSGSLDPSHVLLAIGLPHEVAHGSLRLTLNEDNTQQDVDYILKKLPPIVEHLRQMSPTWEEKMKQKQQVII